MAIDAAVLTAGRGRGLKEAHGIAIHFPGNEADFNNRYPIESGNPMWVEYLQSFYAAEDLLEVATPPEVEIQTDLSGQQFNSLNPPFFSFLVTGLDIERVTLWGGLYLTDESGNERRQLLELDPLVPEPTFLDDGSKRFVWRDGLHDDFFIWSTLVEYLNDGTNGQFVIMWPSDAFLDPTDPGLKKRTVEGIYISPAQNERVPANLVFDLDTQSIVQAWGFTERNEPFEIIRRPGDQFQPYNFFLDENDRINREPGVVLNFNDEGNLLFERRTVVDGRYFFGFEGENLAGKSSPNWVDFEIANNAASGRKGYLDPYIGFQFAYPEDWYRPVYDGPTLFTSDQSGDVILKVDVFPDIAGISMENLKANTLSEFGSVEILYEDQVVIDQRGALSTAYGYTDTAGRQHTGIFYTFVHEENGYVIDIDGLTELENDVLTIGRQIASSFTFRRANVGADGVGIGLFPAVWPRISIQDFGVPKPEDFIPEPESGGWTKMRATWDSRVFMAIRSDAASDEALIEILDKWAAVAGSGVPNYSETEPFRMGLGDRLWIRRNFSYQADTDGGNLEMVGFVMATRIGDRVIVSWAEAPADMFSRVESNVFGVMLAELDTQ